MPVRYRFPLIAALAAALIPVTAPASAQAAVRKAPKPRPAVAYQISVAHDGYSADTTIKPPLTHRWTAHFTGSVSYPLIAGGLVFVTVGDNSGSSYGTTLYALRQTTGAVVWSQPISGTYYWSNAAYDGGHVFVLNYNGLLREFSATTGAAGWSVQLPGQYSFSSPPTASGGVVYAGGAGSGGTLYAVSESNGAVLWTQGVANGDHSSPALSSTDVYVSYACGLVYAFSRKTGQRQWFSNGPCEGGGGKTPVYHAGAVYARDPITSNKILNATTGASLGTFTAGPAPAFAGKVGLFLSSGTLRAVQNGTTLWSFAGDGGLDTAPIVVGKTVYAGSSSGMVYGIAVSTGKVTWSADVGAAISGPDEQNVSQPLTGLGAGQGLLVVPAAGELAAYYR